MGRRARQRSRRLATLEQLEAALTPELRAQLRRRRPAKWHELNAEVLALAGLLTIEHRSNDSLYRFLADHDAGELLIRDVFAPSLAACLGRLWADLHASASPGADGTTFQRWVGYLDRHGRLRAAA